MPLITIDELFTPQTAQQWLQNLLTAARTVGLQTTSWQPGGMMRTLFALVANQLAAEDQLISVMAQGGFLDFAATVTPDPSVLGASTPPGWLDLLADSVYNVQRSPATYASGSLTLTNTSASNYGPFAPGTYHVSNPSTGKTYSNSDTLSIGASATTTASFVADVAGADSTAGVSTITVPVTALIGVTVTNPLAFIGANAESNANLVTRCRAKLGSLSPNGPKSAYDYFALSADSILRAMSPPEHLTTPVTKTRVIAANGVVTTYVASAAGAVPGVCNLAVVSASNTTPITIGVIDTTGMTNGMTVLISGVQGNTAANGYFQVSSVTGSTFVLDGSVGNGSYTTGGAVEAGDLGLVDSIIQANCVPLAVQAFTVSASGVTVNVVTDVYVPTAAMNGVSSAIRTALATYFASVPIGGISDPGGAYTNILPFDAVLGAIFGASSQIRQATLTLNGTTANVPLLSTQVVALGSVTINVHGV